MLSRASVAPTLPYEGLSSARDFYGKKLGLRLVAGSPKMGFLEFAAGDGTTIQLFESDSRKSEDTAATFEVPDLEGEMAALRRRGIRFEEYDLPGVKTVDGIATMDGHRGAWIKDPGGNILALHEGGAMKKSRRRAPRGARAPERRGATR